jgi:hypothetical protein
MRNKELLDRRLDQVDGKIKHLKFLIGRPSSVGEFKENLVQLEEIMMEVRSIIERDLSPLRQG